jgi:hypothetical protein
MEAIDRKFKIAAVSLKSNKKYTQANAVLFLAKDALLPELLDHYYQLAFAKGADDRQLVGIMLLKERVVAWQATHAKQVHVPDVDEGKEEKRVCKPNNL